MTRGAMKRVVRIQNNKQSNNVNDKECYKQLNEHSGEKKNEESNKRVMTSAQTLRQRLKLRLRRVTGSEIKKASI